MSSGYVVAIGMDGWRVCSLTGYLCVAYVAAVPCYLFLILLRIVLSCIATGTLSLPSSFFAELPYPSPFSIPLPLSGLVSLCCHDVVRVACLWLFDFNKCFSNLNCCCFSAPLVALLAPYPFVLTFASACSDALRNVSIFLISFCRLFVIALPHSPPATATHTCQQQQQQQQWRGRGGERMA